jgi:hypothetical protein
MFYNIKSLSEINLDENNFLLGVLTLVNIFKSPGYTVLNCSGFDESILVLMY